ncbi:GNAT family N-acetyltransferase [Magnetospirillum sulfuroxidans]|uniref:GNAT family N-acetyltransferase n=1 Tax=Magnetospirillum sulfuroxidans TaxID=611300 RepID=A0ABS5IE56_9PROT|nr:GNAT family N-acetyltransferase [Magnetospirillum sulfuroxidans]MBR9972023.1 GNAT family N-acetyltransferase [Magnetospirillum sulfuroxidans]
MIRPLLAFEAPALAEALAHMDPWRRLGFSDDGLAGYLTRDDANLLRMVYEQDGQPVGLLCLRSPWLRGPYVEMLAVVPDRQSQGVGSALLAWAAGQNGGNLWVCVSAFNHRGRDFYGRNGFVEKAELNDLISVGEDEILMRKKLR